MPTLIMMTRSLHQMQPGEQGLIVDNACDSLQASRLAALGLTSGASVVILRGGSPMLLRIGESRLCVRADEIAHVAVLCC